MAKKEKRGGVLHNDDVEKELRVRGGEKEGRSYRGSQDTGDDTVRNLGTPVQRRDGLGPEDQEGEDTAGNRDPE